MSDRELTFSDVVQRYIDNSFTGIHTACPGRIEAYDSQQCRANVIPCVKKRLRDGSVLEPPVIANVPVLWPRTGSAVISMPLTRGDYVLLVFCERSIDAWLSIGGIVDPDDYRKFDLSDAVAIPGLFPFGQGQSVVSDHLQIRNGEAIITVKSTGDIEIGGTLTKKLLTEAFQLIYNGHTHVVSGGTTGTPLPLTTAAELTTKVAAQ